MPYALDSRPFTTYHYHENLHLEWCPKCDGECAHHVLKYRTYFLNRYPIIPTRTTYYLTCSECGKSEEIENEATLMKLLHNSKGQKLTKYNKYSILELETVEAGDQIRSLNEEFQFNVKAHVKDMK